MKTSDMCIATGTVVCLITALAFIGKVAAHYFVPVTCETVRKSFHSVPRFDKESHGFELSFTCLSHGSRIAPWRDIPNVIIGGSIVVVNGWALIIIVSIITIVSIIISVIPITLVVSVLTLVLTEGIIISSSVIHESIHWVRN